MRALPQRRISMFEETRKTDSQGRARIFSSDDSPSQILYRFHQLCITYLFKVFTISQLKALIDRNPTRQAGIRSNSRVNIKMNTINQKGKSI